VTDVNGWQTAYGYDGGRSRPAFERSVTLFRGDLREAGRRLTDPPERELLAQLSDEFDGFMNLDVVAYRALRAGQDEVTKRIFERDDARRRLTAVAVGAGLVIVLLLITARDLIRRD
jgi:hypothetical protein